MTLLLGIFTFILVIVSVFMVLVILAQRAKSDGGVGAALGGGVTEAAFGAESGNVLSRATTYAAVIFFVLSFGLYLGHLHQHRKALAGTEDGLPELPAIEAPATPGGEAADLPPGMEGQEPTITLPTQPAPDATAPAGENTSEPPAATEGAGEGTATEGESKEEQTAPAP